MHLIESVVVVDLCIAEELLAIGGTLAQENRRALLAKHLGECARSLAILHHIEWGIEVLVA